VSGIGMLTVGMLGAPIIGAFQSDSQIDELRSSKELAQVAPAPLLANGVVALPLEEETIYSIIDYNTINGSALDKALSTAGNRDEIVSLIGELKTKGTQRALAKVIIFPLIMLVCYLIL